MHDDTASPPAGDVLVVDDEGLICELIAEELTERGFAVRQAWSGEQALRAIADKPPAVVLLDFMMPQMNGGQVVTKLRADGYTFPIAIITASPFLAIPFLNRGVVCIEKPFDIEVVIAWIRQYVRPASSA